MIYSDGVVDLNKFERQTKVAEGEFFKYMEIIDKKTAIKYIAKISRKQIEEFTKEKLIDFSREVNIHIKLKHPSVLQFYGYSSIDFKNKNKPVIILESASKNSLESIISLSNNRELASKWNDTKKLINIYGIASSMQYLHSHEIIHRNLIPSNIIFNNHLYPKLTGFTISKDYSDNILPPRQDSKYKGSTLYLAPEILSNLEYSKSSDVYSFALVIFSILTNEKPFKFKISEKNKIFDEIVKKLVQNLKNQFLFATGISLNAAGLKIQKKDLHSTK